MFNYYVFFTIISKHRAFKYLFRQVYSVIKTHLKMMSGLLLRIHWSGGKFKAVFTHNFSILGYDGDLVLLQATLLIY